MDEVKAKRLVKKIFRSAILNGEVVLYPYTDETDIQGVLQYNLISEGRYLVFYERNEKNHIRIKNFAHLPVDSDEDFYIRLIPVRHRLPAYAILAFPEGNLPLPLDDEPHTFSEWVNHVIAKLIGVMVYQRHVILTEQWIKEFPIDETQPRHSYFNELFRIIDNSNRP